jgi:hypothetical protein
MYVLSIAFYILEKHFTNMEQRMCLGTFLRLRRSLATPTLYAAVRIPSGAFFIC